MKAINLNKNNKPQIISLIAGIILLAAVSGIAIFLGAKNKVAITEGNNIIAKSGTYTFTNTLSDQIYIKAADSDEVKIVLDGASITNDSGPTIYSENKTKLTIELLNENRLVGKVDDESKAAIYVKGDLNITGDGKLAIESTMDGINANGAIEINDSNLEINCDDDGIHSDTTLSINSGTINITKSNEGLEANIINLNSGEISIVSSDDGINATNSDGQNIAFHAGDAEINIKGGKIKVDAIGDGLDSNGKINITGGETIVNGPTNSANSAIDADGEINITGGLVLASGPSGMATNASNAKQPSILINLEKSYSGDISFGGLSFSSEKTFNSLFISSPKLKLNTSYDLVIAKETIQTVKITDNILTIGGKGMGNGRPNNGEAPSGMPGNRGQANPPQGDTPQNTPPDTKGI